MNRLRARDDRGSASVYILGLVVAMLVLAGLVVDGGRAVNARSTAADDAEQAARAGALQVDTVALHGGRVQIDTARAHTAALAFLATRDYDPGEITVDASPSDVRVTVRTTTRTALLSLIMIPTMQVSGSAVARPAEGIVNEIGP